MEGFENHVKSLMLDDRHSDPKILISLKGQHKIKIVLANNKTQEKIITVEHYVSPMRPAVTYANKLLSEFCEVWVGVKLKNSGKII